MSTHELNSASRPQANKLLRVGLWIAQSALFIVFILSGYLKLTTPIPQLSGMMPWTGELSETFVRFIGFVDLAGGLGILLPALTRILPGLGVAAAAGITVLQVFAIIFHLFRGEYMVLPLNLVLLPLAIFVLWGRVCKAPVTAR
ncbi:MULTISPECIES: DoxX family protein [Enterobacteriaceae]|uniref:DoxX family protein n=1 Tax=Enterobacteriaceae TaxID=543 RepID=UPI000863387B|nr:DoxX family protein [Klebsiella sp. LTGPAF-6F]AOV10026.1 hypothetical protein BJF97_02855 [Klebsiella sp. LTGPAF-6F]